MNFLNSSKTQWKWKSLSCVQLFPTSWTIQSMEYSRTEYWSGWPFPSPGDLPNPGIEPRSPALQVDSLPTELWGKPHSSAQDSAQSQTCSVLTPIVRTDNQWVSFVLSHWLGFMQTLGKNVYWEIWGYIWRTCQWVIDYDGCSSVLIFLKLKYAQVKNQKVKIKMYI